jgi:hypothetical protein
MNIMPSFNEDRDAFEKEGVFIGGWSVKNSITPEKLNGIHSQPPEIVFNFVLSELIIINYR